MTYIEEDIGFPVLTPTSLVLDLKTLKILTYKSARSPSRNPRKLPGRDGEVIIWHNLKHSKKESEVKFGRVAVIKVEEQNRPHWNIGIIIDVFPGKDGGVRNWKKSDLERVVQHPYLLEISWDIAPSTEEPTMDVNAEEFRPRRNAPKLAQTRIIDLANDVMEEPLNNYLIKDDLVGI